MADSSHSPSGVQAHLSRQSSHSRTTNSKRRNTLALEIDTVKASPNQIITGLSRNLSVGSRGRPSLPLSRHHRNSTNNRPATIPDINLTNISNPEKQPQETVEEALVDVGDQLSDGLVVIVAGPQDNDFVESPEDAQSDAQTESSGGPSATPSISDDDDESLPNMVSDLQIGYTSGSEGSDMPADMPAALWSNPKESKKDALQYLEEQIGALTTVPIKKRVLVVLKEYLTDSNDPVAASTAAERLDGIYDNFLKDPGARFMLKENKDLEQFVWVCCEVILGILSCADQQDEFTNKMFLLIRALYSRPRKALTVIGSNGLAFTEIPTFETVLRKAWRKHEVWTTGVPTLALVSFLSRLSAAGADDYWGLPIHVLVLAFESNRFVFRDLRLAAVVIRQLGPQIYEVCCEPQGGIPYAASGAGGLTLERWTRWQAGLREWEARLVGMRGYHEVLCCVLDLEIETATIAHQRYVEKKRWQITQTRMASARQQ